MKRNLMILAFLAVLTFIAVPAANSAYGQGRHGRQADQRRGDNRDWDRHRGGDNDWDHNRNRGKWRKKNAHGYRNYGQYRRTQVGNRRSHYVRRYYYSNGTRLSRLVRVFY